MSTTQHTKPQSDLAKRILARRRTRELPDNTPVRTDARRCTEPGCKSTAVLTCSRNLGGNMTGSKCDRLLCLEHAAVSKGALALCGPHRRHPETRGR